MYVLFSLFALCAPISLMARHLEWSFPPELLSTEGVNASWPKIGIDPTGNVVAVWMESGIVKSRSKSLMGEWGYAATLSNEGASSVRLVVDLEGNATAIWLENGTVNAAVKPSAGYWGSYAVISSAGASSCQLALDASGNVAAIWVRNGNIEAATKLAGQSWPSTPDIILTTEATTPYIAIGTNGTIAAIWTSFVDSVKRIHAATKVLNENWSNEFPISTPNQNCGYPKAAVDSNGNVMAAWYRFDDNGSEYANVILQIATKSLNDAWTSPMDMSKPGIRIPADVLVRYDGYGNAILLWSNSYDGSKFNLEERIKPKGQPWSNSETVVINFYQCNQDLAVGSAGDAIFLNLSSGESSSLFINCMSSNLNSFHSGYWGDTFLISIGDRNAYPRVALITNENSIYTAAVWVNYNGTNTAIHAVTGEGTVLTPPTDLDVSQVANNLGVFTEYYNVISWQPNPLSEILGYAVYRNGLFLQLVDADMNQYIDHNRKQNEEVTYGIASVASVYYQGPFAYVTYYPAKRQLNSIAEE